jgi:hypothetical protein
MRLRRLHDRLDRWLRPEPVLPMRRTWGDTFRDLLRGGMRASVLNLLKFLLWLFGLTCPVSARTGTA